MSNEMSGASVPTPESQTTVTVNNDDLAELLAKRERAKPNRWTWVLIGALVLAVGFIGGAFVGKQASSGGDRQLPDFAASGGLPGGMPGASGESGDGGTDGSTGSNQQGGGLPAGGMGGFGGMTMGTIASVGDGTLVVTDQSGNEVTVTVGDDTSITKQAEISLQDLAVGTMIVVRGETDDDGNVTAQSISEGGGFGGGMGMPGGAMPGLPGAPGAGSGS